MESVTERVALVAYEKPSSLFIDEVAVTVTVCSYSLQLIKRFSDLFLQLPHFIRLITGNICTANRKNHFYKPWRSSVCKTDPDRPLSNDTSSTDVVSLLVEVEAFNPIVARSWVIPQ